jgi:hypothetical protein
MNYNDVNAIDSQFVPHKLPAVAQHFQPILNVTRAEANEKDDYAIPPVQFLWDGPAFRGFPTIGYWERWAPWSAAACCRLRTRS